MIKLTDKALLPAGLRDALPPAAAFEDEMTERLMKTLAAHGYDRVKPPLIEFEESLLQGSGAALSGQTFRLMDPVSQRMMGVRPDITMQVARIAATRLRRAPRPLRLSYAGEVLRVRGSQLRPERQFGQVGAEIIGTDSPLADVEVVLMAIEALTGLGLSELSVDLGLPTLVPALCKEVNITPGTASRLVTALNRKDAAAIASLAPALGKETAKALTAMVEACGPAAKALPRLQRIRLPAAAAAEREALADLVAGLRRGAPDLTITVDAVERRGFEYHTGVTYAFFALGLRGELGRGGRYRAGNGEAGGEPATGLSLFMDTLHKGLPEPEAPHRLYLPVGTADKEANRLRREGWVTVAGFVSVADLATEARRLRCTHIFENGDIRPLRPQRKG